MWRLCLTISQLFLFSSILFCQGYICAIGGGSEDYNDWSDRPYTWIVEKSNYGKIIILTYSSATNWLPNYFMSLGADTSYNLIISNRNQANLQNTYNEIIAADGIFIKGGDQWQYIRFWKNTLTDSAIVKVYKNGGIVAGTSAGAAILGSIDFSAKYGTVYSDEALQNPFNQYMQFETSFINLLPNVLFDSHFTERGRQGRLISILYNLDSLNRKLLGIGIDDRTALCIDNNFIGEVLGSGAVSFFYKDVNTKYFENKKFTTIENINTHILTENWKFDLISRQIEYIPYTAKSFSKKLNSSFNNIAFFGNSDFNDSLSFEVLNFFENNNCKKVLIISHIGFNNKLNEYKELLTNNNYNTNVLSVSKNSTNLNATIDIIKSSDCFLFYGDSLSVIQEIANKQNTTSNYFIEKIKNNIPIIFFGETGKLISENYFHFEPNDFYSAYYGRMIQNLGFDIFPMSFETLLYENYDLVENRMCSLFWNLMKGENELGIALNVDDAIFIDNEKMTISNICKTPVMYINTSNTLFVDTSTYKKEKLPRQICAFDKLQISLNNNPNLVYDFNNGKFAELPVNNRDQKNINNLSFQLKQNYPNPFNPGTLIKYRILKKINNVLLKVYDILGNEVSTLVNKEQSPGNYEVNFDGSKFSSGIYFYRIIFNGNSITKKMVLLK